MVLIVLCLLLPYITVHAFLVSGSCSWDFECATGMCAYDGTCVCNDAWVGEHCNVLEWTTHSCTTLSCVHGTCHEANGRATCRCNSGWTGLNCGITVTVRCGQHECVHGNCIYSSVQNNHLHQYHCVCHSGWDGVGCDQDITSTASCVNAISDCKQYQSNICTEYRSWASSNCRQFCGFCTSTTGKTASTTTTTTTTTTTNKATTTTIQAPTTGTTSSDKSCEKFSVMQEILAHTWTSNVNAALCQSGGHGSSEAFVLNNCNVSFPQTWTPGRNIMTSCLDIPLYSPVATFVHGLYASTGGGSGILLGCMTAGFKIGLQTCDTPPHSAHLVVGGLYSMDPYEYYTII